MPRSRWTIARTSSTASGAAPRCHRNDVAQGRQAKCACRQGSPAPWIAHNAKARHTPRQRTPHLGTVRYARLVPKEECAKQLAERTLPNLYNTRPTWLDLADQRLDAAVSAAYGWPPNLSDDDNLSRLLALNLARAKGAK
jgi:hypothetical protein